MRYGFRSVKVRENKSTRKCSEMIFEIFFPRVFIFKRLTCFWKDFFFWLRIKQSKMSKICWKFLKTKFDIRGWENGRWPSPQLKRSLLIEFILSIPALSLMCRKCGSIRGVRVDWIKGILRTLNPAAGDCPSGSKYKSAVLGESWIAYVIEDMRDVVHHFFRRRM